MAIAFDAASSVVVSSGVSTVSWNHTVGPGTDRILKVSAGFQTTASSVVTVSAVTYGGVGLTLAGTIANQLGVRIQLRESLWYLLNPSTGISSVHVTYSNSSLSLPHGALAVSYNGVSGVGNIVTSTGNSSAPSQSIILTTGGAWGVGALRSNLPFLLSTVSGETIRVASTAGTDYGGLVDVAPGTSGSNTINLIRSGVAANAFSFVAAELLPAGEVLDPRAAIIFQSEVETPLAPRRAMIFQSELEAPFAPRGGIIFQSELEVPLVARASILFQQEFEVPTAPRSVNVFMAELETPFAPRGAIVFWSELETPLVARAAALFWSELEVPTAPRGTLVHWSELEVPLAPRGTQLFYAEFETPLVGRQSYVFWTEIEIPSYLGPSEQEAYDKGLTKDPLKELPAIEWWERPQKVWHRKLSHPSPTPTPKSKEDLRKEEFVERMKQGKLQAAETSEQRKQEFSDKMKEGKIAHEIERAKQELIQRALNDLIAEELEKEIQRIRRGKKK